MYNHNYYTLYKAAAHCLLAVGSLFARSSTHAEWAALYGKRKANNRFPKCVQNVMTENAIKEASDPEPDQIPLDELYTNATEMLTQLHAILAQVCDCYPTIGFD